MFEAVRIEVAPGELVDKLTILDIKLERIGDAAKRRNVGMERRVLAEAFDALEAPASIDGLVERLRRVNEALWAIEDDIRDCERRGDFGAAFVALARAVYRTNDERADLKRAINLALGSRLIEEKSYRPYGRGDQPRTSLPR